MKSSLICEPSGPDTAKIAVFNREELNSVTGFIYYFIILYILKSFIRNSNTLLENHLLALVNENSLGWMSNLDALQSIVCIISISLICLYL